MSILDETLILKMEDHNSFIYFSFDIIEIYDFYDDHDDVKTLLPEYIERELIDHTRQNLEIIL